MDCENPSGEANVGMQTYSARRPTVLGLQRIFLFNLSSESNRYAGAQDLLSKRLNANAYTEMRKGTRANTKHRVTQKRAYLALQVDSAETVTALDVTLGFAVALIFFCNVEHTQSK
jgi:hypothetical protein